MQPGCLRVDERVQVPSQLDLKAAAVASLLGVLLPLVSAIVPTLHAMDTSVRAALDTERAGPTVTKLLVHRRSDPAVQWQLVLCGAAAATLGLAVYYLMPLALLSGSVTMLLDVFFVLLLVMLLGLVLVAMNICRVFEQLLLVVLVRWWEARAVYQTAKLNLQAHRQRNRHAQVQCIGCDGASAVMVLQVLFALATSFVVFISCIAQLQVLHLTR